MVTVTAVPTLDKRFFPDLPAPVGFENYMRLGVLVLSIWQALEELGRPDAAVVEAKLALVAPEFAGHRPFPEGGLGGQEHLVAVTSYSIACRMAMAMDPVSISSALDTIEIETSRSFLHRTVLEVRRFAADATEFLGRYTPERHARLSL